jgi:hypothetical protein
MKKLILATILAVVFVSGTIIGTIPFATAASTDINPNRQIIKQLNSIGKILEKIDQRLEKVLGHVGPPDEPLDPEILVALHKIRSHADSIVAQVDSKLGGTVPPPPTDTG